MGEQQFGIFSPVLGLKQDFPVVSLQEGFMPSEEDSQDIIFHNGVIRSAKLRLSAWSQSLPDTILHVHQFKKRDDTKFTILGTKRDLAYRDSANDRLVYITPRWTDGVIRVENGSKEIYGGKNVDDCDDDGVVWVDGSGGDVTVSRDTSVFKENTASVKMVVAAGATVEDLAYHDITSVDLTTYDSMGFWFRSSVALDAGDLTFRMGKATGLGTLTEDINLPAISADTWTWVNLTFADPVDLGAILSIGIHQAVDKGAMTLNIDQIVAGDWAGQLNANDFITIGSTYSTDDTWYLLSAVNNDTHITVSVNYAGSTAYQQTYNARQTFTGAASNYWRSIDFNDNWIATNDGINAIQIWNGTDATTTDLTGSPPKAKYIGVYENYVVLAYIIDSGGNSFPQKYQWCSVADQTAWATGDAGENTIPGISDFITGISPGELEGFKIIGTERSIWRIHLIAGDAVFQLESITFDIGITSGDSMVNHKRGLYSWCSDNTFRLITLSSWQVISEEIDAITRDIHPDLEGNMQGIYNEEWRHIIWTIPTSAATTNFDKLLIYDLDPSYNQWTKLNLAVAALGNHFQETTMTWDTHLYDTWDTWAWDSWDTRVGLKNFLLTLVTDYTGATFQLYQSELDNGNAYTRKFVLGSNLGQGQQGMNQLNRVLRVRAWFEAESSGGINLSTKQDEDGSWTDYDENPVSIVETTRKLVVLEFYLDLLARHFLFRWQATNRFRFIGMLIYYDPNYGDYYGVNS